MIPKGVEALFANLSEDPWALGVRPSGVRTTDYVARPVLPGAPPTAWMHPGVGKVPVKSQQGNTCVGNVSCAIQTLFEYEELGDIVSFDGEALNMHVVGREHGTGAAASPHDVLEYSRVHGLQSQAGIFFPKAYGTVEFAKDAIMAALAQPKTLLSASLWLTENFSENPGAPLDEATPSTPRDWGYHQVAIVGYDNDKGGRILNSWSKWWGDNGTRWLSWNYLALRLGELWAVTDSADTAKDGFVKTYDYGTATERAIKRPDLPTRKRPAVYLLKNNARIWIKDPWEAKRFGVDLTKVEVLPDNDEAWDRPVAGPDAPRDLR